MDKNRADAEGVEAKSTVCRLLFSTLQSLQRSGNAFLIVLKTSSHVLARLKSFDDQTGSALNQDGETITFRLDQIEQITDYQTTV